MVRVLRLVFGVRIDEKMLRRVFFCGFFFGLVVLFGSLGCMEIFLGFVDLVFIGLSFFY